ncbi:MAG: type II secretion system protein, partial [Planctomycetes bacterium]|nr:type II secretion system protein [Planctomycetota bacterium]
MRRAFTLIELLVVITVLAIMAGLVIAAAAALGIGSKKAATVSIVNAARHGIESALADAGSAFSGVEHPLAGSRPGRAPFVGIRGRTWDAILGAPNGGTRVAVLDRTSEALTGLSEWELGSPAAQSAERQRLLMPEDVFADDGVPLLYG